MERARPRRRVDRRRSLRGNATGNSRDLAVPTQRRSHEDAQDLAAPYRPRALPPRRRAPTARYYGRGRTVAPRRRRGCRAGGSRIRGRGDRDRTAHARPARRLLPMERRVLEYGCGGRAVSYTHLRAHETVLDLVCRLLLE